MLWTALRAVACDEDTLHMECYDGDTIQVISANYGRRDTVTCPDGLANNVECVHSDTFDAVHERFAVLISMLYCSTQWYTTKTKRIKLPNQES